MISKRREYGNAFLDMLGEEKICLKKETVLPEGSKWVPYRAGKTPIGSKSGSPARAMKGKR